METSTLLYVGILAVGVTLFIASLRLSFWISLLLIIIITAAVSIVYFALLGPALSNRFYYSSGLFGFGQLELLLPVAGFVLLAVLVTLTRLEVPILSRIASLLLSLALLSLILGTFIISFPIIWIATWVIYRRERSATESSGFTFRKNRPFFAFGAILSEEQLVFNDASKFVQGAWETISRLCEKFPETRVEKVYITDRALRPEYSKSFLKIKTVTSLRTTISIMFSIVEVGSNLYVKWWSLLQGRIRGWEVFRFILFSPLTIPFWLVPWTRKEYSILASLAGTIEYTYDVFDISAWLVAYQNAMYTSLIQYLDSVGVDVSAYKLNPPGYAINISGSGNIIGAVAQGQARAAARVRAAPAQAQG